MLCKSTRIAGWIAVVVTLGAVAKVIAAFNRLNNAGKFIGVDTAQENYVGLVVQLLHRGTEHLTHAVVLLCVALAAHLVRERCRRKP